MYHQHLLNLELINKLHNIQVKMIMHEITNQQLLKRVVVFHSFHFYLVMMMIMMKKQMLNHHHLHHQIKIQVIIIIITIPPTRPTKPKRLLKLHMNLQHNFYMMNVYYI
eukprot:UN03654